MKTNRRAGVGRCLRMNRRTKVLTLTVLMAMVLIGIYALGILIPEEAVAGSFLNASRPPSMEHPFGTDALGRDLLLRTLKGMAVSMTVGIAASAVSAVIAACVGMAAASGSKGLDALVNRVIDLVMGVPHTVLIILISFAAGRGFKGLFLGIAATHWCSLARLIRGEVLKLRSARYVALSRRLGRSDGWILIHHLLPHLAPQFLVELILMFPHAILHEASISFLGFGLPPEQPAIGIILSESMRYLSAGMWWPAVLPGTVLVLIVLLVDRLGENLQRITDPFGAQE
ncbi:MAG: ABC transporter permease [Clostridium sp.]|nr:ABC transporter permease [Acetatifactor muris]MCM1528190.1 ABC transporter permease [Bacteroides sp.]MCM1564269.1 ABC transporter permease [Clostridium sp.]